MPRKYLKLSQEEILSIHTRYTEKHETLISIAKSINRFPETLSRAMKRSGLSMPPRRYPVMFSEQDEITICDRYANNLESSDTIAHSMGRYPQNIRDVLKRNGVIIRRTIDVRKADIDHSVFDIIDTEEKAYWVGFISADGYIISKTNRLAIGLSPKDENHLVKFLRFMSCSRSPITNEKSSLAGINSRQVVESLARLGISDKKTFTIMIPKNFPNNLIRHYIRGYFDGDGCIYQNPNRPRGISATITSNTEIIKQLRFLLSQETQTDGTLQLTKNPNIATIYFNGRTSVEKIYKFLYTDSNISLDRKRDKFESIFGKL